MIRAEKPAWTPEAGMPMRITGIVLASESFPGVGAVVVPRVVAVSSFQRHGLYFLRVGKPELSAHCYVEPIEAPAQSSELAWDSEADCKCGYAGCSVCDPAPASPERRFCGHCGQEVWRGKLWEPDPVVGLLCGDCQATVPRASIPLDTRIASARAALAAANPETPHPWEAWSTVGDES